MSWTKNGWMLLWLMMRIGNGESANKPIRYLVGSIGSDTRPRNKEKKALCCNFSGRNVFIKNSYCRPNDL